MSRANPLPVLKARHPVLHPANLFLGDNGRCFCGAHAGCSAKYTGRDISGQRVLCLDTIPPHLLGATFRCESVGCAVTLPVRS